MCAILIKKYVGMGSMMSCQPWKCKVPYSRGWSAKMQDQYRC